MIWHCRSCFRLWSCWHLSWLIVFGPLLLSDSQQLKLVLCEVLIAYLDAEKYYDTSALSHFYGQLILSQLNNSHYRFLVHFSGSAFMPSQIGWSSLLLKITWWMESLSIWNVGGVVCFIKTLCHHGPSLSKYTEGVAHIQQLRTRERGLSHAQYIISPTRSCNSRG